MTKKLLIAFTALFLLAGCAGNYKPVNKDLYKSVYIDSKVYQKKFNNMYVILDASSSMGKYYSEDATRFMVAKMVASGLGNTLPEDMGFGGALRTFGRESLFESNTQLRYLSPVYSKRGYNMALDSIKGTGGTSDLDKAIRGLRDDIANLPGSTALIIISDGEYLEGAISILKELKHDMGDNLCVYTIFSGSSSYDQATIDKLAKIGLCGFSRTVDNINVGDFIKTVFLAPAGDKDRDGVLDPSDECPTTPFGAKVNDVGCWIIKLTLFDFDRSKVKPEFYPMLNDIALVMSANPKLDLRLEGRADSVGSEEYNKALSKRRADSVKKYLVEAGIGAHRIIIDALGETSPLAPNDTPEGRQQNRSVKPIVIKH
jgi:OOP family OmpA-OmpF porin